jgi:hypothetical protein
LEDKTGEQATADLSQLNEMNVTDLEAVRALTDQTKMKILEAFGSEPRTVKQVAATLKMVPNNLYYHINQLENLNLIKVVSTRVVSGIIEKQYITTARTFTFSRTLIAQSNPDQDIEELMNNRILSVMEATTDEVKESLKAGLFGPGLKANITTVKHHFTQAQVSLIADKFQELINSPEFENCKPSADETMHPYRIAFSVFPLAEDETDQEPE